MSLAKDWLKMAEESVRTARQLKDDGQSSRAVANRAYYGAYQAATALLHHMQCTPPTVKGKKREAWSHALTPDMMRDHLGQVLKDTKFKNDIASNLATLYKLRCDADYNSEGFTVARIDSVLAWAGQIHKIAHEAIAD